MLWCLKNSWSDFPPITPRSGTLYPLGEAYMVVMIFKAMIGRGRPFRKKCPPIICAQWSCYCFLELYKASNPPACRSLDALSMRWLHFVFFRINTISSFISSLMPWSWSISALQHLCLTQSSTAMAQVCGFYQNCRNLKTLGCFHLNSCDARLSQAVHTSLYCYCYNDKTNVFLFLLSLWIWKCRVF